MLYGNVGLGVGYLLFGDGDVGLLRRDLALRDGQIRFGVGYLLFGDGDVGLLYGDVPLLRFDLLLLYGYLLRGGLYALLRDCDLLVEKRLLVVVLLNRRLVADLGGAVLRERAGEVEFTKNIAF